MLDSLVLSLAITTHVGVTNDTNRYHPNIGYYVNETVSVGAFYNSEKKVSYYIAKDYEYKSIDINVGFTTGYETAKVLPYIILSKQIADKINVFVVPTVDSKSKNPALVLGIGYQFK